VGDFFNNVWTGMMENPVLSGIVDMIRSLWENLSTALQGIWQGIQTAASTIWSGIQQMVGSAVRGLVRKAVEGVAGDMVVSPKLADMQAVQAQGASLEAVRQMVSGLREMFAGMQSGENFGTICIPVYVGGTLLDEVVVDAQARQNLRSGGR